jgi:hypothetical protein
MSVKTIQSALDRLRNTCPIIRVADDFDALFLSDTHLGIRDLADDFHRAGHEDLFLDTVRSYPKVCVLGDFTERAENPKVRDIWFKYPKVFRWLLNNPNVYQTQGNHNPVKKYPLALRFVYPDGKYIFCTHGHKGDWACDQGWWLGKFFVRYIWAGVGQRIFGMADPTTARKEGNPNKHLEVRRATNEWVNRQGEDMLGAIWGHTHFQELVGRSFNDGSWIAEVAEGVHVKDRTIILKTFT